MLCSITAYSLPPHSYSALCIGSKNLINIHYIPHEEPGHKIVCFNFSSKISDLSRHNIEDLMFKVVERKLGMVHDILECLAKDVPKPTPMVDLRMYQTGAFAPSADRCLL